MGKVVSVRLKTTADTTGHDQYSKATQKAVSLTKDLQKSAGDRGTWGQAAFNFNQLADSAIKVYSAFTQVFSIADQWADMGVGAERNKIALQSLTGAGAEYEAQINAIVDATRGMVTEGEAAGYAYRLQRFGLAETADEMERFMRTVSIVSAINPQLGGTAEAINQIQLTLSNMSFMRLDQLGISAGQVRDRMEELGKAQKDLSTEERFQIAVMEQLEEQANAVGDSILEMTDAQERMKARWKGFKEDWGLKIAEGFEGIATAAELASIAIDKVGVFGLFNAFAAEITGGKYTPPKDITVADINNPRHGLLDMYAEMALPPDLRNLRPVEQDFISTSSWASRLTGKSSFSSNSLMSQWELPDDLFGRQPRYPQPEFGYQVPPRIDSTPPMDYDDYYARQRTARFENPQEASLGTTLRGAVRKGATEFGDFAGQAQEVIDLLPIMAGGFTNIAGAIADGQSTLAAMVEDADILANMSLEEFWGTGASTFDTSVYSEMTTALQNAGVEGDAAAAAMQAYQINTGMANASSEIFRDSLADLTAQLQNGEITATEYALAVSDLSRQDFSWADKVAQSMVQAGDLDQAIAYIEALKTMTPESWAAFNTLGESMQQGVQTIQNALFGGAPEGEELVPGVGKAITDLDTVMVRVSSLSTDGAGYVAAFNSLASEEFDLFATNASNQVGRVKGRLEELQGVHLKVYMDIVPMISSEGATGPTPLPPTPGGGSPNVAPLIVPTAFPAQQSQTIVTQLVMDKQVVAQAVSEANRVNGA